MALKGSGGGGASAGAIRAGRAVVELGVEDGRLRRGLESARRMVMQFGKSMAFAGGGLLGAGGGILGGIGEAFRRVVGENVEMGRFADKIGVNVQKLSAFAFAAETTGVNLQELKGHYENWAERVQQGALGIGEATDSFKRLGLNAKELMKLDMVDQFIELSRAMESVTNETERLGLLSKFGGDKFQWLNTLLKLGPEKIRALMGDAAKLGAAISPADAERSLQINLAWTKSYTALKYAVLSVGSALLPHADVIVGYSNAVTEAAVAVRGLIGQNAGLVLAVVAGAAGVVALGGALTAVGMAGLGVSAIIGAISAVLGVILTPVALLTAGLVGLGVALLTLTEGGQGLLASVGGFWVAAFDEASLAFGKFSNALMSGDLDKAMQIAGLGVQIQFKSMTLELRKFWTDFLHHWTDGWQSALALIKREWAVVNETIFNAQLDAFQRSHPNLIESLDKRNDMIAELTGEHPTGGRGVIADARIRALNEELKKTKGIFDSIKPGFPESDEIKRMREELARLKGEMRAIPESAPMPRLVKAITGGRGGGITLPSSSLGGFSAADWSRFFAGAKSDSQRQLKATEDTAKNTGRTVALLESLELGGFT